MKKKVSANVITIVLLLCTGIGFIWGGMICATKSAYGLKFIGIFFAIIGYFLFPIAACMLDKSEKEE